MKNKKILFLLISVLVFILVSLFLIVKNFNSKNQTTGKIQEYTPAEEISEAQLRETMVSLYFLDKTSNNLKSEGKLIDSALLLQNPYKELINLLIKGPSNDTLLRVFPDNTQVLDAYIKNGCVSIDFSEEILNVENEEQQYNIINSILNTLTQLNEVNSIKILVNNESSDYFKEEYSNSKISTITHWQRTNIIVL